MLESLGLYIKERDGIINNLSTKKGIIMIGDFQLNVPEIKMPEMPDLPSWYMWSDTQFEIIKKYVEDFEASLDKEHEVGLMLTHFGQSVLMQVTEIGYEKSVLLVFKGTVNGNSATLIQHINQLNFMLTSIQRSETEKPKVKIGFRMSDAD